MADRDKWPILDNIFNQIDLPGEPYYGLNEDTLGTQVDVDEQAGKNLRIMLKDVKSREVSKLPDVERVNPPNLTRLRAEQLLDIKRVPTDWAPKHVTLSEQPQQLFAYRPGRKNVIIANASAILLVGNDRLNLLPNEAGTGPVTNKYFTINSTGTTASGTLTLETEGPIWVYCATLGATCDCFETFWDMHRQENAEKIIGNLDFLGI